MHKNYSSNPETYRERVRENERLYGRSEVMREQLRHQEAAYTGMAVARRRKTERRAEVVLTTLQQRRC
jgi:hypothetical protein